jgi:hypothetical protein
MYRCLQGFLSWTNLRMLKDLQKVTIDPAYRPEVHLFGTTKTTLSTRCSNRDSLHIFSVHMPTRRYCFAIGILPLGFQCFIENNIQNFTQTHNSAMVMHWKYHRRCPGSRASNIFSPKFMLWSVSDHGLAIRTALSARRLSRGRDGFWGSGSVQNSNNISLSDWLGSQIMRFDDNSNVYHYISSGYFQNLPIRPQYVTIVDWMISDRHST